MNNGQAPADFVGQHQVAEFQRKVDELAQEAKDARYDIIEEDIGVILRNVEGCTRSQAVKALKEAKGDLVNAIMYLTGV